MKFEMKNDVQ